MITQAQLCQSPANDPVKEFHLADRCPRPQPWDDTSNPLTKTLQVVPCRIGASRGSGSTSEKNQLSFKMLDSEKKSL